MFLTIPTATFGSTRALEKSHGSDTSMFREFSKRRNDDNHQLEYRVGTSSLIRSLEIPALSGFLCYLGNLQRDTHR